MSDKANLDRIRREVEERAASPEIGGARWQFDLHWLIRQIDQRDAVIESLTKEHDIEWGIKAVCPDNGIAVDQWGYKEDPRTTGLISEENYIELYGEGYGFYEVLSVGKRIKPSENWEAVS